MDEYTSTVRVWELTCPGFPEEISRARRFTRDILTGTPFADDAALIVTELGANALVHTTSGTPAGGTFHFSLTVAGSTVTITVTDHGGTPTAPKATHPAADATHGRGLALVEALATRMRIHGDERGHTVTAELTTSHHADKVPAC